MNLRLSGEHIPQALFEVVAAVTNKAKLRHHEVEHDATAGLVRLPITRFPLVKSRPVLGDQHDHEHPIRSVVTVRNVVTCDLADHTTPDVGDDVMLLFGIHVRGREVHASSAEEDRGRTCFSVTAEVSEIDLEITDEPTEP